MEKLGIPSWPELERPRERLIDRGAEVLSDAQLLAIMIRMGKKGQTAIDIALKLLEHFNGLKGVAGATIQELCQFEGIGPSKAAQILGAIEIGKRAVSNKKSMKGKFLSSKEVFSYFSPEYSSLKIEVFKVILLNTKNQLIQDIEISKGSLSQTIVHPREVFNKAIKNSAASIILIHNHPSGDPTPSLEDFNLTQNLVKSGKLLGIPVLDHIVIGSGDYYSFADRQTLVEK
ncbi:MAG: RadC family protein [Nitrospiria bacterium]